MKVFGQGAVNIAGHKLSYGLLAAGAGIVGAVLLFIQMRSSGGSLGAGSSSAGVGYTDAYGNTYDANGNLVASAAPTTSGASGADWQSAFSALSSQIAALSAGTTAAAVPQQPSSPAAVPAAAGYAYYGSQLGNTSAQTGGAPTAVQQTQQVDQPKPSYAIGGTSGPAIARGYSGYAAPIRNTATIVVPGHKYVPATSAGWRGPVTGVTSGTQTLQVAQVNPPGSTAQLNEDATGYVLTSQYGAGL